MTLAQLTTNDLATSDDTSIWLLSLPLKGERFSLTKREFFDAVLLKYESEQFLCKAKYNIDHELICKAAGFFTFAITKL